MTTGRINQVTLLSAETDVSFLLALEVQPTSIPD